MTISGVTCCSLGHVPNLNINHVNYRKNIKRWCGCCCCCYRRTCYMYRENHSIRIRHTKPMREKKISLIFRHTIYFSTIGAIWIMPEHTHHFFHGTMIVNYKNFFHHDERSTSLKKLLMKAINMAHSKLARCRECEQSTQREKEIAQTKTQKENA